MKTVAIAAPRLSCGMKALFEALGDALGVCFVRRDQGDNRGVSAWIVLEADRDMAVRAANCGLACYIVPAAADLIPCGSSSLLEMTADPVLPTILRHRRVTDEDVAAMRGLPPWFDDVRPLACKGGVPVWAIADRMGTPHHFVAIAPPELAGDEPLFAHFSRSRLAALLPLVNFVLDVGAERGWEGPPLQASYMFDDPNLHWASYGFVDYRELIRQATARRYHVAFATVPLDAWWVHKPTRTLFEQHPDRISLLYHGNDHTSNELGNRSSVPELRRLLSQAVGRVSRFEASTGLSVSSVMAPPHGACSDAALGVMSELGFEAATVSRGSLHHHNPSAQWTTSFGFRPCGDVAGLPVIPRFGLTRSCGNDILIAALLRQPIIPVTHHDALADGYGLLSELADVINGLGAVRWASLGTIARGLYAHRINGEVLQVRLLTGHVVVNIPPGITKVAVSQVEQDGASVDLLWRAGPAGKWAAFESPTISVSSCLSIEIAARSLVAARSQRRSVGMPRFRSVGRRLATEMRDRALPLAYRLGLRRASPLS